MNFEDLTEDNVIIYAMKYYDNPQCIGEKDFYDDLKILKYIKRLFNRYQTTGSIKERLVLNHMIMFTNLFPPPVAVRIMFLKIGNKYWSTLKTFLLYLDMMPDFIDKVNGKYIYSSDINVDLHIAKILREIKCQS